MAFTNAIKGPGSKWRARGLASQSDLTEFRGGGQLMEISIKPKSQRKFLIGERRDEAGKRQRAVK